jgi:hypothetical protein
MTNIEFAFHAEAVKYEAEFWSTAIDEDGQVVLKQEGWAFDRLETYTPNVALFQSSLDWITNNPQTWNQENWFSLLAEGVEPSVSAAPECGTAGCLAGTVMLLEGKGSSVTFDLDGYPTWTFKDENGDHLDAGAAASRALGIPYRISDALYHYENQLWDLWDLAQVACGGALTVPERSVIEEANRISKDFYS